MTRLSAVPKNVNRILLYSFSHKLGRTLNIDFVQFSLANVDGEIVFKANYLDRENVVEAKVPRHQLKPKQTEAIIEIPPVPRSLNTALARCKKVDTDLVLIARDKILRFDDRIQEIANSNLKCSSV